MARRRVTRKYKRVHYNTDVRLLRQTEDENATPTYGPDGVPTNVYTQPVAWTGKGFVSPNIFLRQRREWPNPDDYAGYPQDVGFWTALLPIDASPQETDVLEVFSDTTPSVFYQQISPPKNSQGQDVFWHLDLSEPLAELPA